MGCLSMYFRRLIVCSMSFRGVLVLFVCLDGFITAHQRNMAISARIRCTFTRC